MTMFGWFYAWLLGERLLGRFRLVVDDEDAWLADGD